MNMALHGVAVEISYACSDSLASNFRSTSERRAKQMSTVRYGRSAPSRTLLSIQLRIMNFLTQIFKILIGELKVDHSLERRQSP